MRVLLSLIFLNGFSECSKSAKTVDLINKFVDDPKISQRPGLDNNTPVVVNISFNLVAIVELNEVKGYISTIGFWNIVWMNEHVTWNSSDYEGIQYIVTNSNHFWKPDLMIGNPAEEIYNFEENFSKVKYYSNGSALWQPGSVTKSYCYIELPGYPFDMHTCFIRIISWGTTPTEVSLQSSRDTIETTFYSKNTEWDVTGTSASVYILDNAMSMAVFNINLSRKSIFLVVNVLIPIMCLSVLNSVVFLLPHDSGERVSFSVTVLLSFTVFLNVIGDNVPKASTPLPLLCYYVITVLVSGCVITLLAILSQRIQLMYGEEPAPEWLVTSINICKKRKSNSGKDKLEYAENKATDELHTWRQITRRLDTVLFLIFFTLSIAVALGFLITMMSTGMPKYLNIVP